MGKKKFEQGLHKKETGKANKHMKSLSTLDIREMKNKTRRYCYMPTRMGEIKRQIMQCQPSRATTGTLTHCVWGAKWPGHYGKQLGRFFYKVKHTLSR